MIKIFGTRMSDLFVRNCEPGARRYSAITWAADPDRGLDLANGANSRAQKIQENCCTICCTIPDTGGWLAELLAISSTQCDGVRADRAREV
jgi:hypothetical protein